MAYWDLSPKAAPGVDGVTWEDYGQDLAGNLRDLHDRVHSGRYQARPSRRAYIPKADGRLRPLGIATVSSYCLFCSRVSDVPGWRWSGRAGGSAGMSLAAGADISQGAQWRRGLVRRAAGLRCPDAVMRSRQAAWIGSFQVMHSRFPGPRRVSSCPRWIH
jgi:hypothetical protein